LRSEDIQTDATIAVDVGVVYARHERHLWWFEGIVWWKLYGKEEDSSLVRTVLGSHDSGLPFEHIFLVNGTRRALGWGVATEVLEFFVILFKAILVLAVG